MDYFSVSDFAVGMNPLGISSAILEYGTQRIGSLSAVDTDSSVRGPFYGVPSNDDSFIIASFYFSMALNAFEYGRVDRYHSNFFSVTNTLNS